MKQVLGALKIIVSIFLCIACALTFYSYMHTSISGVPHKKYDTLQGKIAVGILITFALVYLCYLVWTGIWNVTNRYYSINILLLTGLLFHFIFTAYIFYWGTKYEGKQLIPVTIIGILGVITGIYDFKKFLLTWKAKRNKANLSALDI